MTPLRVALLTPTFWPVANRLLAAVRGVAERCQAAGARVTVVTEKLEPDWSSRLRFRDCDVLRVERPMSRPWSRGRFGKALVRALTDELAHFPSTPERWDAVIVCDWPEALLALEGQIGRSIHHLLFWFDRPLPPEARGSSSAARAWQASLRSCSGLLSPHPRAGEWLGARNENHVEVAWLPDLLGSVAGNGGEGTVVPSGSSREAARKTLAEIHPLLNFERQQLLAVCAAEMVGDPGVFDLLAAWRHLRREEPRAQLLLVGDGPQSRAVWSRIHDWHLQGNVVMPGSFDDYQELLRAADFYIHPLRSDESCPFLSLALSAGTPCAISEASPWSAEVIAKREAWLFPAGSPQGLLECLRDVVADAGQRAAVGIAGAAAFRQATARALPLSTWLRAGSTAVVQQRTGAGS